MLDSLAGSSWNTILFTLPNGSETSLATETSCTGFTVMKSSQKRTKTKPDSKP